VGDDEEGALIGKSLAQKLNVGIGGFIRASYNDRSALIPVRGIVQSGGAEEQQIFVHLKLAQKLFNLSGKVERVQVGALVTPDNALAVRANRIGPSKLPPEEYETWYCTPYLSSMIYQLEEAIPNAKGKAIRQVSEAEGAFLSKMRLTFALMVAAALFVASLGVMATMVTAIFERRIEIGLMKALGAEGKKIGLLFFLESGVSGLAGGLLGYFGGVGLAKLLAAWTFSMTSSGLSFPLQGIIFFVTLIVSVSVALFGSLFPVRGAMLLEPVKTLRGN
jgi:putative ABC transport system permease protein